MIDARVVGGLLALALALPTACRPAAGPVEPAPSMAITYSGVVVMP